MYIALFAHEQAGCFSIYCIWINRVVEYKSHSLRLDMQYGCLMVLFENLQLYFLTKEAKGSPKLSG